MPSVSRIASAAAALLTLATAATLVSCSSGGGGASSVPPAPSGPTSSPTMPTTPASSTGRDASTSGTRPPSTSATPASSRAARVLAAMSLRERVGQLLMVDCPSTGVGQATTTAITTYHVGSVILDGTTTSGTDAVAGVTRRLQGLAPKGVGLFVATDQEGGLVQRLQGSGFSRIPSAVDQGGESASRLTSDATTWGRELRAAGVNVNLAPVLDTVPSGGGANPPIGDLDREYGHTPGSVTTHGLAYAAGMTKAGVDVTVKHFPGLGRVAGNTDTTSGVTDTVTTRHDAYLAPFRAAVARHVPFVMVSTAIYTRIDPDHPAAFSTTVVTGMLRDDLGYDGLVITDDVGSAKQVSGYSVGQRAVAFVAAGGDVVLTVDAGQAQAMTDALATRARTDPAFAKQVDAAALRVLTAKQAAGLL